MKRFIYLIGIVSCLFTSCEQEIMTYEGEDAIYFDVRYGAEWGDPENEWAHQYYTPVEFNRILGESYTAQLRVKVTGTKKDYDRPFKVTVVADSTNAVLGEDYEAIATDFVIKAGETQAYVDVVMKRTTRMAEENVYLTLQVQPNEYFTTPFTTYGDSQGHWTPETTYGVNKNASMHKIVVNDILVRPEGWYGLDNGYGLFGKYSVKKYLLLMEVTGTEKADFLDKKTMPNPRAIALSQLFASYLLEQAQKGREHAVLDEDGTMMWCSYITTFGGSAIWTPFTNPDDYYK